MLSAQTIKKREPIKKLVTEAGIIGELFTHRTPSMLCKGSVISAQFRLSQPSSDIRPSFSFHPDPDFHWDSESVAEIEDDRIIPSSISLQDFTAAEAGKDPLESYRLAAAASEPSFSEMETVHGHDTTTIISRSNSASESITSSSVTSTWTNENRLFSSFSETSEEEEEDDDDDVSNSSDSDSIVAAPRVLEHPCVERAKRIGINVRDFAYEEHGVRPAPVVDDITNFKAEYLRMRSNGQEPPRETMAAIKFEDPDWFQEHEEKFASAATAGPASEAVALEKVSIKGDRGPASSRRDLRKI